jgi:hypothetical protein
MTGLVSRSGRDALPEERGADERPDPSDAPDLVPSELRHDLERVTDERPDHDGPPYDHCVHCEAAGRVGSINPFGERCPAQDLPSAVEVRAEAAEADDSQASLTSAHARADGGAN